MEYGTKYFVLAEGRIQEIGIERLAQLYHGVVPEYVGQKIPFSLLLFERVGDKLKDLRYWQGGCLVFDEKGKSAIVIHREYLGRDNFTGYHFWARGYCVSTVGLDEHGQSPDKRQTGRTESKFAQS
jgi:hypothetical protein